MKKHFVKLLSTFLSAILVFSVTVVGLPTTVNAETATTTSTTGENLMADYTAENWAGYVWNDINDDRITEKRIRDESANYYSTAKGAIFNKEISWQYLYTKVNLEPNTTYNLKFYTKVAALSNFKYVEYATGTNLKEYTKENTTYTYTYFDSNTSFKNATAKTTINKLPTTSETTWTEISLSFTTSTNNNVDRYISFRYGDCGINSGYKNCAYFSDFSLVKAQKTPENLMADYTAKDFESNFPSDSNVTLTSGHDTQYYPYGSALYIGKANWKGYSTKVNLEPNTTYTFKFSTYSTAKEFTMHKIYYAELDKSKTITWKSTVLQNNTNHLDTLLDSDAASSDTSLKLEAWNDVSVSFTTTSATDVDRYIIFQFGKCYSEVNNASATAPAWVTGFSLLPVRTEFATAYNNAASIRLGTNTDGNIAKDGLRVKNEITTKFIQDNKITEYGSVVAFADSLGTNELTLETAGAKTGVAYNSTTNNLWATTTDSNIYTAYITGFKDATSYSKEIAVRAYAKNSSGNVYYGKTFTVCLYDVVYAIKNAATADGSTPSKLDTTTAQAFIDKDSNTYNTWKNGKAS